MSLRNKKLLLVGLPAAFDSLSDKAHALLETEGVLREASKGEILQLMGTAQPSVMIAKAGLLALRMRTGDSDPVIVEFVQQNELLVPTLDVAELTTLDVIAVTKSSIVTWPQATFLEVLKLCPEFACWVCQTISRRLNRQHFRVAHNATLSLEGQYAYFLWALSRPATPGYRKVPIKVSQQMLSAYFGVTREEVSRKKQLLEKAGYVTKDMHGDLLISDGIVSLFASRADSIPPAEFAVGRALSS